MHGRTNPGSWRLDYLPEEKSVTLLGGSNETLNMTNGGRNSMKPPKIPLLGRVVIATFRNHSWFVLGLLDLCHLQRFVRQLPVVYHSADYSRVGDDNRW